MIDFDDDLDEILSEDDHAVAVEYNGNYFSAILNQEFVEQSGSRVSVESTNPVLYAPSSIFVDASHGDTLTAGGSDYIIVGIQPDGEGITVLVLDDA